MNTWLAEAYTVQRQPCVVSTQELFQANRPLLSLDRGNSPHRPRAARARGLSAAIFAPGWTYELPLREGTVATDWIPRENLFWRLLEGRATSGTKYEKTIPLNENCYFANPILKYFISSVPTVLPILAAKSPWKPAVPYLFPDCSQALPSHSSTLPVLI